MNQSRQTIGAAPAIMIIHNFIWFRRSLYTVNGCDNDNDEIETVDAAEMYYSRDWFINHRTKTGVPSPSFVGKAVIMVKRKIDQRLRTLVENGVQTRHRSLFVIVGDHGQYQVPNIHYILSKAQVAKRPSVLWCYKKELGFSSHKKKRMRQMNILIMMLCKVLMLNLMEL